MTTPSPGDLGGARVEMRGESRDSSTFTQIGTQVNHQRPLPEQAFRPWAELAAPAGLSNLPHPGLFIGRADELAQLDAAMAGPGGVVVQAVHGLGGVGKSTLAARWAAAHAGDYTMTWWIIAATVADIDAGLAALAIALQPALTGVLPLEALREGAVQWLAAHSGWLVMLDNVTDPADVAPLLARTQAGRYLITSRRATGWHAAGVVPVRLDVLDAAEAQALLATILIQDRPGEVDGASELCEELGFLPLAIEQAGAYLAQAGATPREYLDLLARYPAAMYQAAPEGGDAARTIARIWHVTLDRLADDPGAGEVLRILAWYAPDAIPRMLLDGLAVHGLADPPAVLRAVGRLAAYSMLTADAGTLTMHRLVQAVTRTPDPGDPHRNLQAIDHARHVATGLLAVAVSDWRDPAGWADWRRLLPHIDALASHAPQDTDTETTGILLRLAGLFLEGQGQPDRAAGYLQRALASNERVLGIDHPYTLNARSALATAYRAAGDLGQAIPLHEQVLADRQRVLGQDHRDTLASRGELAVAYQAAGNLSRAISLHERLLADRQRVLGQDHSDTLAVRNNLAYAYQAAGDLERAIPMHERALADRQRVLGHDHRETLTARGNLAYAYQAAGDLERAIPMHERALADSARVLGVNHPDTLTARANLAAAYQAAGNLERAISLCEGILADRQRVLGQDHPDTLTSGNNLAYAYQAAGNLERAIPLNEQVLADSVRVLGVDHPGTLTARANLAAAYQAAGNLGRAISLCEEVLADRQRVLGQDHPSTLNSGNNLAEAYEAVGDLDRATPLRERVLADSVRVLGVNHPGTLTARANLAAAYQAAGNLYRAIPVLKQVLADSVRVLGQDHPDTLTSGNVLAGAYEAAGNLRRAIPLYEQVLADRRRVLGQDHPDTLTSGNNLAGAYEAAGNLGQAIPLYEQTLAKSVRVLGANHPATLASRNNLAYAYQSAGNLRRAIPLYEQALARSVRVLGQDHPQTKIVRDNLATARQHLQ